MIKLPRFKEFVAKYKWARLISDKAIEERAKKIFSSLKNKTFVSKTPINNKISKIIMENVPTNGKGNINASWKSQQGKITGLLKDFNFYELVDPSNVRKDDVKHNKALALDINFNKPDIVREKVFDPATKREVPETNKFKLQDVISDYNVAEPTVLTREEAEKLAKDELKKARAKAAQSIVDNFEKKNNEKSVEEQIKNSVTKIAKNKELMNLSKEQLRDYLRDAYEISDENALNNMMNAVVAKRAELLANKQLKQEELTEIDISKLQEQSQRDFEKKLQDQNLRYILPAQIEKRERLVQNRLNPELLKGGY